MKSVDSVENSYLYRLYAEFLSNDRHAYFENARDIFENYINSEGRSLYYYKQRHTIYKQPQTRIF